MSTKHRGAMSDWEFIRAAQVERRECQEAYDCAVTIELGLDEKRSVVQISVTAWDVADMGQQEQLCRYTTSWPNASTHTFPVALFQATVQLNRLVEDSRRDAALESTKR